MNPPRIPHAPPPGEWWTLPCFEDTCDGCGRYDLLVPGTDRCQRCDLHARAAAQRGRP